MHPLYHIAICNHLNHKKFDLNIVLDNETLCDCICNCFGVSKKSLLSNSRLKHLVILRQLFSYYAYNVCKRTLVDIGKFLNRDHTTIVYSRDMFDFCLKANNDEYLNKKIEFDSYLLQRKLK